jgi:hypothetical protein
MFHQSRLHPLIARLIPSIEYPGGDGGNANCGKPGYGGCSPGFAGDTAHTNDWAGTWHNYNDLISNNTNWGYSEAAQDNFTDYGYRGYLFSPGSPSYNMQNEMRDTGTYR